MPPSTSRYAGQFARQHAPRPSPKAGFTVGETGEVAGNTAGDESALLGRALAHRHHIAHLLQGARVVHGRQVARITLFAHSLNGAA